MRVLVLNGSPKGDKSNTYRLTSAFLDGLRQTQPVEAETLEVGKLHLLPCRGCFACWSKTPGKCVLQDDMAGVIEKILAADVLIWSFPLYYFSIPGQLKLLIDRQLPMSLPFMTDTESGGHPSRYDRSGQRQVVISTCGFYTAEGNYDAVDAQFSRLCSAGGYTSVYCGQGELFRVPALRQRTDAYLELVKQAGAEFVRGAISAETACALRQPLFPRAVFEQMADASWASAGRILPRKRPRRPGSCLRRRPLHGRWPRSMTHRHGTGRIVFWNFSIRTPAKPARSCSGRTVNVYCNQTSCPARRALKRRFPSGKRSAAGNLTASRP